MTLYTAGHLHTAEPHCSHSRAPIVHTAVPRENNEHGCVYLRCRAVCKLPGCVEGHPCKRDGLPSVDLHLPWFFLVSRLTIPRQSRKVNIQPAVVRLFTGNSTAHLSYGRDCWCALQDYMLVIVDVCVSVLFITSTASKILYVYRFSLNARLMPCSTRARAYIQITTMTS